VKCDATQPICNRCNRDGKECVYQKSRRGGLDKAALARRRLRLQKDAGNAQDDEGSQHQSSTTSTNNRSLSDTSSSSSVTGTITCAQLQPPQQTQVAFQVNNERLLDLFFEYFWPSFPIVLPPHYLQVRRLNANHGVSELLPVMHWIGSLYEPRQYPSEPYYQIALEAISSPNLAYTPFNVQAMLLFAIAQYHCDVKAEARKNLDTAITMALLLDMNERHFAQMYGEGDLVLEESWRRTYYILHIVDQHFAIVSNTPFYTLLTVPNTVDLPCDDNLYFESDLIPPPATWSEYQNRELAEIEIVYSSLVYLYDMTTIIAHIMTSFLETGYLAESTVSTCGTKLAIWFSLLPSLKKKCLQKNGDMDEVMFTAHMIHAIAISTLHRPFSALAYTPAELRTTSFSAPSPFILPASHSGHTARVLRATEMHARLLAIPCAMKKHSVFTMCITAQLAAVQIAACTHLLDGRALDIARDRVRLSIGFLSTMGETWALGKKMVREVRGIARESLSASTQQQHGVVGDGDVDKAIGGLQEEMVWPVDLEAGIDIHEGVVIPFDWDIAAFGYASSMASGFV
jgi:hypothetical protein